MTHFNNQIKQLAIELFKIGAIKFGEFKTKVGLSTPVYCDLRVIVSYPKVLESLTNIIIEYTHNNIKDYDIVCGVPYTALPIGTAVSIKADIPMVMRRKQAKNYGTKNLIEGKYNDGDRCLVIEDVVTSGSSILETVRDLQGCGISCSDVIILLNRQQGGEAILAENGIRMHSLLSLTQWMEILEENELVDSTKVEAVKNYIASTQVTSTNLQKPSNEDRLKWCYSKRIEYARNPVAKELLKIMVEKESNLCVAADLTSATDILNLAEEIGPYICCLKTHIDIVEDFHPNFIKRLKEISERHNFILFEDRKFADIGKTVELQYTKGVYNIASWAKLITCHSLFGKGVLDAIKQSPTDEAKGVFLLAEGSAEGCLIDSNYTEKSIKLADEYPELITGLVCQSPRFIDQPGLLQLTPGVQLGSSGDNLKQQYCTPRIAVVDKGADVAVVGRGITKAADRVAAAKNYRELLWDAYLERVAIE